jgi:Zn-dependent M28 family amino/carboxypeptidase
MTSPAVFVPDLARLERDVRRLSVPRHPLTDMAALRAAEDLIAVELGAVGLRVERQLFTWDRTEFHNVLATRDGTDPARPWVIVGAHFDSTPSTPGADDNASAVAAMLEVARLLRAWQPAATIQYVGFNLEEVYRLWPPVYRIGSRAYVEWLVSRRTKVAGALVLEMVGYTSPTQRSPAAVQLVRRIPKVGNFLAAVGDGNSRALLKVVERAAAQVLPLETLAVPMKGWLVPDVRRSDNARFWDAGYPALMVTDTADLRNPHYHRASDTPDTLDYGFMGKVVEVIAKAVVELAGA